MDSMSSTGRTEISSDIALETENRERNRSRQMYIALGGYITDKNPLHFQVKL